MKKNSHLLMLLSSLVLLSSCSPPVITPHPEYPIRSAYIVGRWILPFNEADPPLYDTKAHRLIGTPDYEILDFKKDGTFSVEIHMKNETSLVQSKDMHWKIGETTTYNEGGPALLLKNMRYYPSALTGVVDFTPNDPSDDFTPNNPDELILQQGRLFSKDPNDLFICFEDGDVDLCFGRETPLSKK